MICQRKKESVNYLDDGPYVSSTKNMLKDVEIQRKLYSLEEYKKQLIYQGMKTI